MDNFIAQLMQIISLMQANFPEALMIVAGLWIIHFFNALVGYRLNFLGIYPRHIAGLFGLPFYSFLHANFGHLLFNSIPLIILIDFLLIKGERTLLCVSLTIIILSGLAIWLFSRRGIHIGASCLVMGYWSYLLVSAYQYPSVATIVVMVMCLYYFGGLLLNLFPTEEKVSWEGHIFGFLAGIVALYIGC